ncbi:MAG: DUF362 domain-containing protein [Spirochaetales bacterium]|nr:DUF362 domain-containing protein [Spirochaetales bacterium]
MNYLKKIVLTPFCVLCGISLNAEVKDYKSFDTNDKNVPIVYFTKDISPEGLVKVYKAMGWSPTGKVGVKISTGESEKSNHLRPELIGKLVKDELHGTIVECNTAYGGNRASNAMHKQVAKDRGYLEIAPFDLLDEDGEMEIPVKGGKNLKVDYVGSHFKNYNSYLVLSHFKGHAMGGFGGAIKNLSIGFGSGTSVKKSGKSLIHSGGRTSAKNFWGFTNGNENQLKFLESMAEAAKGVCDYMGNEKGIAFVNVMNRLSVDCDCNGNPEEPDMHDIGILASIDPLAIDQACVDLVFTAADSAKLVERIETRMGRHTLEHAEKIGLGKGSRNYRLVNIDE